MIVCGEPVGVDLRDIQIAARHADPRATMRCERARKSLDRHPNYILAAYWPPAPDPSARAWETLGIANERFFRTNGTG